MMTFEEVRELLIEMGFDQEPWDRDESVLDHCLDVADTAGTIAKLIARRGYPIDVEHCEIGGLLHDFAVPVGGNVHHVGGKMGLLRLRSQELLAQVARTGNARLNPQDVIKGTLPLPHKFATPVTIEEKVIAFADWVNHPGPGRLPTQFPVWNHFIESFGPLGATERELSRLTGIRNLWDTFAAHRAM